MRINLVGYIKDKGRNGKIRHRVRVEGQPNKRIGIPIGPNDDPKFGEHPFMEYYLAARAGVTLAPIEGPSYHPLSLDRAIEEYLFNLGQRVEAKQASKLTLTQRTSLLQRAANFTSPDGLRMGEYDRALKPEALEYIRDQWGVTTAQADNCTKAFKSLYNWLRIRPNPAADIAKVHKSLGGATPWKQPDFKAFLDRHPEGSSARLWLYLAAFTGARRDDLCKLGRRNEVQREGLTWLEWQPGKKGSKPAAIPMMPQLLDATRSMKVQGKTYLLNANGAPFKNGNSLGTWVKKRVGDAGMIDRSSHGLRKSLGTLLAEMGCSNHQISAVLSHTKPQTSAVYTESADRIRLAGDAMRAIGDVRF